MKAMIKIKRHDGHDMAVGLAEDMALPPSKKAAISSQIRRARGNIFRENAPSSCDGGRWRVRHR